MAERTVMELYEETGAYLRGHFRLSSGLHSPEYLQSAKVLAVPHYAEHLGRALAGKLSDLIRAQKPDLIVSPAIGGIVIGQETARALGVRAYFTERDGATKEMVLRRGFSVTPGETAVVVEDVLTTGRSTREVMNVLRGLGAEVIAAGSIIDRSEGAVDVGVPRTALHTMKVVAYQPEECPLCKEGMPVVKPGSRPT
jgi:orotate phosphoribosyltransferase